MKNSNLSKFLGNAFIILILSFVTVAALDKISIKLLHHKKPFAEKTFSVSDIRKPTPYTMFKGARNAKAWKKFSSKTGLQDNILNELGYPGDVPEMPKPKNEYRIIVLGGSAVFMGFPPIPRLIQYQFEKNQCSEVKVYNFSVVSSVTSMELARLVHEVVNYAPDLIISYSGFNDIDEPFVADPRPGYPFNYFISESNPILDSNIRDYPLIPLIAYGSNLMRHFFPSYFLHKFINLDSLRKEAGYQTMEWKQAISNIYIENIVKSHKISNAFGAKFMAFFQPSLYFKDFITKTEKNYIDSNRMNSALELREMILKEAQNIKIKKDFYFSDLSNFFDNHSESVFVDRVHLKDQYRPEVAKEVYNHILKFTQTNNDISALNPACVDH